MSEEVKKKNTIKASFKTKEKLVEEKQPTAPATTKRKKNKLQKVVLWMIAGALILSIVLPAVAGFM